MKRGRKPGSLVRARCGCCGTVEMARSAGSYIRCTSCRAEGRAHPDIAPHRNSDKRECVRAVRQAIVSGELPPPRGMVCVDCGGEAIEYEHRDYRKPLDVEPICRGCNLKRGPAIPKPGSLERLVESGMVPYILRHRTEQLFRRMGVPTDALAGLPAKLTVDHWRGLLPLLEH